MAPRSSPPSPWFVDDPQSRRTVRAVTPPLPAPRIAVVGGGIAGLTCARALLRHGLHVEVFDKARKAGGRLSTRRFDQLAFDHGAQYFTIRSPWFRRALAPLIADGTLARWTGRIAVAGPEGTRPASPGHERWVGVPTMSALPRALAQGPTVHAHTRIVALERQGTRWVLHPESGQPTASFDRLVVAIPSGQAAELLAPVPALQRQARRVTMRPCWAVMVVLSRPAPADYDGAFVEDSPLSWVMRQPSKPGRAPTEAWVLHATAAWTEARWEHTPSAVVEALLEAWHARGGPPPSAAEHGQAHRWRYALVDDAPEPPPPIAPRDGITLAGDWLEGGRVEGAFLSGRRAAAFVLRSLRSASPAQEVVSL